MAFTPKNLDGVAASLRASGSAVPGYCLREVHEAFGSPKSDGAFGYANATEARKRAQQLGAIKGYDLDAAPDGAVLYWSNVIVKGKDLGHIAFKQDGKIKTIDNPVRGQWGLVTVAAFKKKWSWLKFEGYAYGPGAYLGHTVSIANDFKLPTPKPVAASTASKAIEKEQDDDMVRIIHIAGTKEFHLTGPRGRAHIKNEEHLRLIRRWLASDEMLQIEVDTVINLYLAKVA